jgi:hypothetical protein
MTDARIYSVILSVILSVIYSKLSSLCHYVILSVVFGTRTDLLKRMGSIRMFYNNHIELPVFERSWRLKKRVTK